MILPLLLAAAAGVAPQPSPLKLFKDWTIGCDNVRACQAVALLHDQAAEDGLTMSLSRGAAPDAPVRIVVGPPLGASDDKTGVVALAVDGKRLPARLTEVEGGAEVDPAGTVALLAALRVGAKLEALGADGKRLGTISLAGASAALLYMDDRQQRVGTVTALARPGPKPANAVPPAPAAPEVVVPPRSAKAPRGMPLAVAAALRKQACESGEPDTGWKADTYRLDAGHTLAVVPDHCDSGAYNAASLLYVAADSGGWRPIRYDTDKPNTDDAGSGPVAYNAEWNAKAGTLDMFMKGRGLGDCGTRQSFAWDGERFRLILQEEMGECRGSIAWIPTWRAKAVRR
ncbi:MAG: DUF1176 domain-containing protein [Alphaproteobacteria bacterium]|nr:DUF1176 domain-containing protein [Alphaproteobacteria bacterium]